MSRIRGIEVKVQKEVLQTRKYGLNEILNKNKNEDPSTNSKDDMEKHQIQELLHKLPRLDKIFEVHRKIGEGTFSSVYLGSLRQHATLPDTEKRWFAIKHLVPTAHPARIEHELRCLQDMGGKDHVIGVELCLRNLDTIVFIMPYIPHKKFSDYVGEMDAGELRQYMRALMTALRHVHSFGVIHRDVKPSNFLYDRENRRYLLVDFGLAQRLCPAPPPAHTNGARKRPREELEVRRRRIARYSVSTRELHSVASRSAGGGPGRGLRVRGRGRRVRRVRGAPGLPRAARRHGGLPAARGAAEVPAADHGRGRVGGRRGAGERAHGALPVLPRGRRRGRAGRAGRPAGHGRAAARRRGSRAARGDVVGAARAVPAQAGRAAARPGPRGAARGRKCGLRPVSAVAGAVPVSGRGQKGGRVRAGAHGSRLSGRGVLAGGAAAGPRPSQPRVGGGCAGAPVPRRPRLTLISHVWQTAANVSNNGSESLTT